MNSFITFGGKHMNLMKIMPITAVLMLIGLLIVFFRQALGPLSTLITAISALAVIGVLGWFVIDYTH
jgi:predicted RND superfamily exporter protein